MENKHQVGNGLRAFENCFGGYEPVFGCVRRKLTGYLISSYFSLIPTTFHPVCLPTLAAVFIKGSAEDFPSGLIFGSANEIGLRSPSKPSCVCMCMCASAMWNCDGKMYGFAFTFESNRGLRFGFFSLPAQPLTLRLDHDHVRVFEFVSRGVCRFTLLSSSPPPGLQPSVLSLWATFRPRARVCVSYIFPGTTDNGRKNK